MSARVAEPATWLEEAEAFEAWNRAVARDVARRRLELEQARAAVPDRGRFLSTRLYPGPSAES